MTRNAVTKGKKKAKSIEVQPEKLIMKLKTLAQENHKALTAEIQKRSITIKK